MSLSVRIRPRASPPSLAEGHDARHPGLLAELELAHRAVLGRRRQLLGERRQGAAGEQLARRPHERLVLAHAQHAQHRRVGEHDVAVPVDHEHGVAQRADQRVRLRPLLGESQQARLVLGAQALGLRARQLVAQQRGHDALEVLGAERLGQEEVHALARGGDGGVDVGVGRDHAHHGVTAALLHRPQQAETVGVGQAVVQQGHVVVALLERRQRRRAVAGLPDVVPLHLEDRADAAAHAVLVVDDEDPARAHTGASSSMTASTWAPVTGLSRNLASPDHAASPAASPSNRVPVSAATPLSITSGTSASRSSLPIR